MRSLSALPIFALTALVTAFAFAPFGDVTQRYSVHGYTAFEVRDAINQIGPIGSDGQHHDGETRTKTNWKYKSKLAGGVCNVDSITVTVDITFIMPDWADIGAAPSGLAQQWRSYLMALTRHENGHKKIALAGADTIRKLVGKIPAQPTCERIGTIVADSAKAILDRQHLQQVTYDKDTDHGRTQGARFP